MNDVAYNLPETLVSPACAAGAFAGEVQHGHGNWLNWLKAHRDQSQRCSAVKWWHVGHWSELQSHQVEIRQPEIHWSISIPKIVKHVIQLVS